MSEKSAERPILIPEKPGIEHHTQAFWEQPPAAIAEYFNDMSESSRQPITGNERFQATWLLETIADRVPDDDEKHFLAALGLRTVPTYAIQLKDIDDATGGALTQHGWGGWMQRFTGQPWADSAIGRHVTTLDMNLFHGPGFEHMNADPNRRVVTHENIHANGIMLFDFLNEGIAMALEFAHAQTKNPIEISLNKPMNAHTLGLLTIGAIAKEHPDMFEQMIDVLRTPTLETYTTLVSTLIDRFGIDNMVEMARVDTETGFDDYPAFLKNILPANYLDEEVRLDGVLESILKPLRAYEQRTGYSFNIHPSYSKDPEQSPSTTPDQQLSATSDDPVLNALLKAIATMQ